MNVYDQAARDLAKRDPAGFFRWLVVRFLARFTFLGWLDTSRIAFPGEPDRVCDTVAEFARADDTEERRILDVEFQTKPHPDMLERLGEYTYRLRRELRYGPRGANKYRVVSVLLNLTGPAQPDVLDMTEEGLGGAGSHLRLLQRTLRDEDAGATLAEVAAGRRGRCVLPWVVLMHGAGESGIIQAWCRLAGQEPDSRLRADLGGLARVFAELTGHARAWRQALKRWNVIESPQVREWQAQARKEGRTEGRKEGEVAGRQAALLRLLQLRFKRNVPTRLATAIRRQNDPDELARWFDVAATVDSLEAFRAAVAP